MKLEDIRNIHIKKLAKPGNKYRGDDGKVYIGLDNGSLKLEINSNVVTYNNTTTDKQLTSFKEDIEYLLTLLQTNKDAGYIEFVYDVDTIIQKNVYKDDSLLNKLYSVDYTYDVNDNLESLLITKTDTGLTLEKIFEYDVNFNLQNITII